MYFPGEPIHSFTPAIKKGFRKGDKPVLLHPGMRNKQAVNGKPVA